ncbi:MAG: glycerol-3-phosphate dehydrogenase [Pyrinomonadaceae bacterium]|nr:glycerol-3-phosphate dehydrogenase [Pyrinomonadaceae bacterium]
MTSQITANISEITFDVIIVGAGINGAGIARDAAMRGLQVLVLDKGDFGGGTTSWSTRLIHGGLRYLEHAELGLVRESLRERETLLRIAPHLVKPLPILLPLYEHAARGPLTIRAGMIAYDMLSLDKSLPRHRMLTRDEALVEAPGLNRNGLRGAAIYYDAQVDFAERLVVENMLSAMEHGATVVTYARVQKLTSELKGSFTDAGQVVEFIDVRTGAAFSVRGRVIVNAAGPWVDEVLTTSELASKRLIGGTKGSHIIVGSFSGAPSTALYVEAETDNRPFFIIPWDGKYLIGTTDIRFTGDLDRVEIDDDEIDYLLRETNRVIPPSRLTRDELLYTYAGVRPLPYTDNKSEERITRRHFIRESPDKEGLLSIVGGKLTTYRNLAEETVDLIGRKLERSLPRCSTLFDVLPGAGTDHFQSFTEQFKRDSRLSSQANERLLRVYGTRAREVLKLATNDRSLAENFDHETGAIAAEVVFSFQWEMAETLADCLLRRTMVGLNSSVGVGADENAAAIAREYLGWSDTRVLEEVAAYRSYVERFQPSSLKKDRL